MSGNVSRWMFCVLTCGALVQASSARAFSDPLSFNLPAAAAGGGGIFFTGSPADGYTCKACHDGGTEPKATVLGLPLSGYRPGTGYEITIKWPEQLEKISLALELTNSEGKAAGSLRLPADGEIKPPEFCDPASEAVLAAQLRELPGGRQIINVPDCGSKRVRFLWTAPARDMGPVWFAGSMVSSDGESDPYHDGVTDLGRIVGSPSVASNTVAQCSAAGGQLGAGRPGLLSLVVLAATGWALSFRRRGRQPSVTPTRNVDRPAPPLRVRRACD